MKMFQFIIPSVSIFTVLTVNILSQWCSFVFFAFPKIITTLPIRFSTFFLVLILSDIVNVAHTH